MTAARRKALPGDRTTPESLPVKVSNPDKVFWPDEGYTKLDLVRFYDFVFPKLQPWVKDRLLSLKRCPNGLLGKCFFQKEKPDSMPPDTPTKRIVHENGVRNYVVDPARPGQPRLHRGPRLGGARADPAPAGLAVLRPRPGLRKVR